MARRMRIPIPPSNLGSRGRVQLRGLREYTERLVVLGDEMVVKGCVSSLAPGAKVMRDAARRYVPVLKSPDPRRKPGTLRDAMVAMRVKAEKYAVTYVVGIKLLAGAAVSRFKRSTGRASSENPNDPFYGTILEFGKTGRTQHPFLKPAFAASAERAVKVAFEHLRMFTLDAIRRIGARQ